MGRCVCVRCGQHTTNRSHICSECAYASGEVWVLDPETMSWSKEVR